MLLRRAYSHTTDDVTIGLEEHTNVLVSELLKDEDRLCVVSICGMGGLGKSTIARKVYNHRDVKNHFDCYAWTSVSQQMNTRELLKMVIMQVTTQASNIMGDINEAELVRNLFHVLEGSRYLVILDDIWNCTDWDILKHAFLSSRGSKVLLSTRNKEIVNHADPKSFNFTPPFLTDEEAWELLCRKALPPPYVTSSSLPLTSDLEKCGKTMVKKCGGLPLGVIVLAGILQSKRSLEEWEIVSKQIQTSGDKDRKILSLLDLSYNDLPFHLKPLFLYLGVFPEDYNICVKTLVRMWMAEGLIKEQEGEDVGRQYLDELIHRSMVEICEKSLGGDKVKNCRLHDIMRELCIDIGKKENFLDVNPSSSSSSSKLRRCAFHVQESYKYVFPRQLTPSLRTAHFYIYESAAYCPKIEYNDFKLLKVLVFYTNSLPIKEFCRVLRKLSNLRYLSLAVPLYSQIPHKFLGNMVCLETLDLRWNPINRSMSNPICNVMPELRHLYSRGIELSKINKMTKLQTLYGAIAGNWMIDLVNLTNLEKLYVRDLEEKTMGMLTNAIGGGGLDKLRSLYLILFNDEFEFSSELLEALSGKLRLKKLRLYGKIRKLPSQFPPNLIKLRLVDSKLSEDPMPSLEKLPHLLFLELWSSYDSKQMVCSAKGFPKLRHLELNGLQQLEEWTVEEGAMPCLATCLIYKLKFLKMVPQGFKFLKMLQELTIEDMSESFNERFGGEDWQTIQHIPFICYTRRRSHVGVIGGTCPRQGGGEISSSSNSHSYNISIWPDEMDVHTGVCCDNCKINPIVGKRYKCKDCYEKRGVRHEDIIGFDLCEECYHTRSMLPDLANRDHTQGHTFELIANSEDSSHPVHSDDVSGHVAKENAEDLEIIQYDSMEMLLELLERKFGDSTTTSIRSCLCFWYLFPKDYGFFMDDIIQLWVAQGFIHIPVVEGMTMEESAYLWYDMFQKVRVVEPSCIDCSTGKLRYKLNHSLVNLLQAQPSLNRGYFRLDDGNTHILESALHASLQDSFDPVTLKDMYKAKGLITLLILHKQGSHLDQIPRDLFLKLPSLKALDLSHTSITELPSSIGNLEDLRYLNLSGTLITTLPDSLCSLSKLQTLKLRSCLKVLRLPKYMSKLLNLRHLDVDVSSLLVSMPPKIGNLVNLQTLPAFFVGKESGCLVTELKKMKNLRGTFRLMRLENVSSSEEAKEAALDQKKHLDKLELHWSELQDGLEVLENLQPHTDVLDLQIVGYGGTEFPCWIRKPIFLFLRSVTIHDCRNCELLPSLGRLPSLKSLSISYMIGVKSIGNEFSGRDTVTRAHNTFAAFLSLECITLKSMASLEKWGGLKKLDIPNLQKIYVSGCPKLAVLPKLSHLKCLKNLEISLCPSLTSLPDKGLPNSLQNLVIIECPLLKDQCQKDGGQDWRKILNIPNIWIDYQQISR